MNFAKFDSSIAPPRVPVARSAPMRGTLRLGRVLGVDVFIHWSWAVVAAVEITTRSNKYSSQAWNIAEYLALFLFVLLHEFGHALACRSVGGRAERIMLWPLGGVAYVQVPPRPGALLWSIAAGPLVNVALILALSPLLVATRMLDTPPDVRQFVLALVVINAGLLLFNLLPVYPLDGGQIAQAVLWFLVGRARSLLVVSVIGIAAASALLIGAIANGSIWFGVIAIFVGRRALAGLKQARSLAAGGTVPRRVGFACPKCLEAPRLGQFWVCACKAQFDTFACGGTCPTCQQTFANTACTECKSVSPHRQFYPQELRGDVPA